MNSGEQKVIHELVHSLKGPMKELGQLQKQKLTLERVIKTIKRKLYVLYVFKINEKLIKIRFFNIYKTAEDCLINVLKNLYS